MEGDKNVKTVFVVLGRLHEHEYPLCVVNRLTKEETLAVLGHRSEFRVNGENVTWLNAKAPMLDERRCRLVGFEFIE